VGRDEKGPRVNHSAQDFQDVDAIRDGWNFFWGGVARQWEEGPLQAAVSMVGEISGPPLSIKMASRTLCKREKVF
jgi:hypothetical protein